MQNEDPNGKSNLLTEIREHKAEKAYSYSFFVNDEAFDDVALEVLLETAIHKPTAEVFAKELLESAKINTDKARVDKVFAALEGSCDLIFTVKWAASSKKALTPIVVNKIFALMEENPRLRDIHEWIIGKMKENIAKEHKGILKEKKNAIILKLIHGADAPPIAAGFKDYQRK